MTIFLDVLNNSIVLLNNQVPVLKKDYDYSLSIFVNKIKAIAELGDDEGFKLLSKDKSNYLILPNDIIGYGVFEIPNFNKKNEKDFFATQFRLAFPKYKEYYVNSFELSRADNSVTYLYSFAKINYINKINDAFKNIGLTITNENTSNQMLINFNKVNNAFPRVYLCIGKYNSEAFIIKGNKVISNNVFGIGEEQLSGNDYLYSAYNINNKEALSFSAFIKGSLSSNKGVEENEILSTDPQEAIKYNEPKQIRLLKDNSLKQYLIKNNYKKFYTRLLDLLNFYNSAPYFIPSKNIYVISDEETFNYLDEVSKEDNKLSLSYIKPDTNILVALRVASHELFSSNIKEERKKIDWKAFFTKEIGRKKKA